MPTTITMMMLLLRLLLLCYILEVSQCAKEPPSSSFGKVANDDDKNITNVEKKSTSSQHQPLSSSSESSPSSSSMESPKVIPKTLPKSASPSKPLPEVVPSKAKTKAKATPLATRTSTRTTRTKPSPSTTTTTTKTTTASTTTNPTSLGPPASPQLKPRVISLNVMVAGLSGLGKTTLSTSLMECWRRNNNNNNNHNPTITMDIPKTTTHIDATSRLFERYDEASNTILRVRIIDTPGFGNRINYWNSVKPITRYIANCRKQKYQQEMSGKPTNLAYNHNNNNHNNHNNHRRHNHNDDDDTLVHVCLYLISPGRFLEIDKYFIKQVQREVTIVPIIAKADTLTDEELSVYRAELVQIFKKERLLSYYNFDASPTRFGYYRGRRKGELLAIISRNGNYPWGQSSALHPNHSDLQLIRDLLLSEHTERFLELAYDKYYNHYRAKRMARRKLIDVGKYVAIVGLGLAQLLGTWDFLKVFVGGTATVGRVFSVQTTTTSKAAVVSSQQQVAVIGNDGEKDTPDTTTTTYSSKTPRVDDTFGSDGYQRGFLGLFGTPDYNHIRKTNRK